MPVPARLPCCDGHGCRSVVIDVEAQAWAGLSVQGSVTTVGPAPGGAVTLIRLVSVPVALGPTVPTSVSVAVVPGDTSGTVQSRVTRSKVPDPFVFAAVSVSPEGGNSWTSASVASPVPVLVMVMV